LVWILNTPLCIFLCSHHTILRTTDASCAAAGSQLLEHSLAAIADDEAVVSAFLHVHTPNTEAVTFYIRHGFVVSNHGAPSLTLSFGLYKVLQVPATPAAPLITVSHSLDA
jgi:hypothetical protein